MNTRNLKNNELDLIGRKLIERGNLRSPDIEKIISNPDLFGLVNARIAAEGKTEASKAASSWGVLSFIRRNAIAFAGVAVVVIAAIAAVSLLRSEKDMIATNEVQVQAAMPEAARPDNLPPQAVGRNQSQGRASDRDFRIEKAVVRQHVRSVDRKPQAHPSTEPDADFYAISYAGDPDDTGGGRIIRVDMSRSSLLALGVNVSLENEAEVVKADLLVGSDGVTRAIRVVK